jgi:hypothetical protein
VNFLKARVMANMLEWVGSIVDVDGPKIEVSHRAVNGLQLGWFTAAVGQKTYLGDHFRTSAKTYGVIEFMLGGRVELPGDTVIRIVSPTNIRYVADELAWNWSAEQAHAGPLIRPRKRAPKKGGWAMFDKEQRAIFIQTSGGVIGIEG